VTGQLKYAAILAYLVADYSIDDGCSWEETQVHGSSSHNDGLVLYIQNREEGIGYSCGTQRVGQFFFSVRAAKDFGQSIM
jgi:hypothetical protein